MVRTSASRLHSHLPTSLTWLYAAPTIAPPVRGTNHLAGEGCGRSSRLAIYQQVLGNRQLVRIFSRRWHKAHAVKHGNGNQPDLERYEAVFRCFSASSLLISPCHLRGSDSTACTWNHPTEVRRIPKYSLLLSRRRNLSYYHSGSKVDRTVPTKKFTAEIDAQLYKEFLAFTEKCRQATREALEQALKLYLRNVVPSQQLVRTEVTEAFEQSVARNRELLQFLAK
jgi:hypothetical protein